MQEREESGIQWLESELLSACRGLQHASYKRHGGVSRAPFESLNFSYAEGEEKAAVDENFHRIKRLLGVEQIATMHQCHGTNIAVVTAKNAGDLPQADVLMTNEKGVGLMARHADCQAAILYDPVHEAVAVVHAGWRGSVQNVYAITIRAMQATYGSHPGDILAGISPSLGPTAAQFIHYKEELPESFWKYQVTPLYFDFWAISTRQLLDAGVALDHIDIAQVCTFSNPEGFFSYRRVQQSGRHGTVAILR